MKSLSNYHILIKKKIAEYNIIFSKVFKNQFNYIFTSNSKYIRSILCLIGYSCFKNDIQKCIKLAISLEFIHNSLLIHDDIMDNALLRRGRPSLYKKLGINKAILSGNLLLIKSYQILEYLNIDNFYNIIHALSNTIIKIYEGQQMDLLFEKKKLVNTKEYIKMIHYKTACFIAFALQSGAFIGNADKKNLNYLYQLGINLGIAFQIQDDLLDIFGLNTGKIYAGDIQQNKKTILYTIALEKANDQQKNELFTLYNTSKYNGNKIFYIKKIFEDLCIKDDINKKISQYKNNSLELLKRISINENKKKYILNFINHIIEQL